MSCKTFTDRLPPALLLALACLFLAGCQQQADFSPTPTRAIAPPLASPTLLGESPGAQAPAATETSVPTAGEQPPISPEQPTAAPAQPAIPRLNPGEAYMLRAVYMLDGLNGWAIAASDGLEHLLITEDGGQTWLDVTPPEPAAEGASLLLTGTFPMPFHAWVSFYRSDTVPGRARLWQTADGGYSWYEIAPLEVGGAGEIYRPWLLFSDRMTGWYLAQSITLGAGVHSEATLFRTFDAGRSWIGEPLTDCRVTGMDFNVFTTGWVTESCLGPYEGGVTPTFWVTADGGSTWMHPDLPVAAGNTDIPDGPLFCETHDPQLVSEKAGGLAVTCYENELAGEPILNLFFTTSDNWTTFAASAYPGGRVLMADQNVTWALGREIYQTQDGGSTWSKIKTVAWDGEFSFIDRWRGWAVASAEQEVALVKTLDGGRTWALLEPEILPQPVETMAEACVLFPEQTLPSYYRPSFASEVFAEVPPGMPVYVFARTADGWIGFDPGIPQAANIGVFHHRWIAPGGEVAFEGDCDDLPIVEGPPPGVCFTMPMGWVRIFEEPDANSRRLVTLTTGEYAAVEGQTEDGWTRVDLGLGNTGLKLKGWMEGQHANFNGPCNDLPALGGG